VAAFDPVTLELLAREEEVAIETLRPDGTRRRTVIWVVVDAADVLVRSVRGERGYWYQAALESPESVVVHAAGRAIPVRVRLADDPDTVHRCSRALNQKYAGDPSTPSMLRPHVLGTTLRLEPR
jgi:hypothetical protein